MAEDRTKRQRQFLRLKVRGDLLWPFGPDAFESDFPSALASSETIIKRLSEAKRTVLETEDLAGTIGPPTNQRVLTFRAAELREFRKHLVILPDIPEIPTPHDPSKRKREFIDFLSQSRQTPGWGGISEGYIFERDSICSVKP
jgi:hypothetical protein